MSPADAQSVASLPGNTIFAPVPFGPGERMTYKVTLGVLGQVGEGSIEVQSIDTVRGFPTYKMRMRINGGVPFAHVDNVYQSWFDVRSLISRRFLTDVKEVKYKRKRTLDFYPEEMRWSRPDKPSESGSMPTREPL